MHLHIVMEWLVLQKSEEGGGGWRGWCSIAMCDFRHAWRMVSVTFSSFTIQLE